MASDRKEFSANQQASNNIGASWTKVCEARSVSLAKHAWTLPHVDLTNAIFVDSGCELSNIRIADTFSHLERLPKMCIFIWGLSRSNVPEGPSLRMEMHP